VSPSGRGSGAGGRPDHYEWCGAMYCEREGGRFEYPQAPPGGTEETECPHCGDTLEVPGPEPEADPGRGRGSAPAGGAGANNGD